MKLFSLVIFFSTSLALSKNLSWPSKVVIPFHQKTMSQVCQSTSKSLAENVCKGFPKEALKSKSKVKMRISPKDTLEVTYLGSSVKIRRTDSHLTYLVNRRSLYLEEVSGARDLQKKIKKLLPQPTAFRSPWIEPARAEEYPVEELSRLLTLLLFQTSEHETCQRATQLAKACASFDKNFVEKSKRECQEDPSSFEKKMLGPKALQNIKTLVGTAKNYVDSHSPLQGDRFASLKKCECLSGLCFLSRAETETGQKLKACRDNLKALSVLNNKCGDVDSPIVEAVEAIANISKRPTSSEAPQFREDSYRGQK